MFNKKFYQWMVCTSLTLLSPTLAFSAQIIKDQASIEILTPSFAQRKTCKLRLKNGMEVFLISDPYAKQSGAALSVEVGSWNDPKEYPGMAHFLEHMLFMGTKAFPEEADYVQYIRNNGGSYNAFTAPDRTVYMFAIDHNAYPGGVDRFSHFFIDPLFSRSSIYRELNAVDQEHAKNVENDRSRIYMVFKETSNPAHPNVQFATGNAATLSGIPQDAMIEWYKKNYSASRMHLVMLSNESLETMQKLADEHFSAVPVSTYPIKRSKESIFSDKQKGGIIYIKPIKDIKLLSLNWEIPPEFVTDNLTQVPKLIAYVLGSEDKNGLSQELKAEHLAESMQASVDRYGKKEAFFSLEVALTEKGVLERDKVIERCYQMIARLKSEGVPEPIFKEMQQLALIDYQYQSRQDVFETMTQYADNMVDEPLETFPQQGLIPTKYDPAKINSFLKTLTPASCLTYVVADPKLTRVETPQKEKWVHAEYSVKPVSPELVGKWSEETAVPQLQLPAPNPYIPQNFTLVKSEEAPKTPQKIIDNSLCTLYHLVDTQYQVPETSIQLAIHSPRLDGSAKSLALISLYYRAFNESLMSELDAASSAGLNVRTKVKDMKLILHISGFSDKAPLLAETLIARLNTFKLDKDRFMQFKQSLTSELENYSKELPFRQAQELSSNILVNDAPSPKEKLKALSTITYEELTRFTEELFHKCHIDALVYGNTTESQAKAIYAKMQEALKQEISEASIPEPKKKVLILSDEGGPYRVEEKTPMKGNSLLLCIQQGPLNLQSRTAQQILASVLEESFFDTLRTKQQTAYMP